MVVRFIARGGMGEVYEVADQHLQGKRVALKTLGPEIGDDPAARQRFEREVLVAREIHHPNVCPTYDIARAEGPNGSFLFLTMKLLAGEPLSALIRRDGRLSPARALPLLRQMAAGLDAAHSAGVIHRDFKPGNVIVDSTQDPPVATITDFGISRLDSSSGTLSVTSHVVGTPGFIAPELFRGSPPERASDIYSFGMVLREIVADPPQPWERVILRCLDPDPSKRPARACDVVALLESASDAGLRRSAARLAGFSRSHLPGWRLVLAAALLLALLAAGTVSLWKRFTPAHGNSAAGRVPASDSDKYVQAVELMRRWDKAGNLDRAVALLTETTRSDPTFGLGFARLAEAQRLRYANSRDKAILGAAARAADEAKRLNPELAPVLVVWGRIQAMQGRNDLAMDSFVRALRIDPRDADANLAIARQYERQDRLQDAEAAYRNALSLEPDSIAAHDFYANFLYRQDRHADAIAQWRASISLAPDYAPAYVNTCASLNDTGDYAEGIRFCERSIQLKPTGQGYSNLGTAYSHTGNLPAAAAAYAKAVELSGNDYNAWGNLAFVYAWMNGMNGQTREAFARAIDLAEQFRKDNPRDPAVHSHVAECYAKTGNAALAVKRIETALALAPASPEIQAGAAEVYELLAQRGKAIGFAKRALEMGFTRRILEQNPELSKLMPVLK